MSYAHNYHFGLIMGAPMPRLVMAAAFLTVTSASTRAAWIGTPVMAKFRIAHAVWIPVVCAVVYLHFAKHIVHHKAGPDPIADLP